MKLRTLFTIGLTAALAASTLAVGAAPSAPAQASSTEGWSALGTGMSGMAQGKRVFQMARTPDGMLYAGGNFTAAGGDTTAANFARWNPTTGAWTPVGGPVVGAVYAVAHDPDPSTDEIWIGGTVTNVSGSAFDGRLARWSVSTSAWVVPSGVGAGDLREVEEIAVVAPNQVYIGGSFGSGTSAGFVMFDGTSTVAVGSGLGGTQRVNGMTADGAGGVILTGQFTSAGGVSTNRVAGWNGTSYSTFGGATDGPPSGVVAAVASTSAGVVIGGTFTTVNNGGTAVANTKALARWNGTQYESIGTVVGTVVEELRVIGDYLYVGGQFLSIGGVTALNIARYHLTNGTWHAITDQCFNGVNGVVRSIIDTGLGDGSIYVGGGFTDAGGLPEADGIAKYTPSTRACPNGSIPPPSQSPTSFRVAGLERDRVGAQQGMRVQLAWETQGGYSYFEVTTRGLQGAAGFDPNVTHTDLTCTTSQNSCSIFFPFTSNDRTMSGRQYHQVIYSVRGFGYFGESAPATLGPLAGEEDRLASAPRNVRAEARWKSITVTWDEPSDLGSAGFATNYLVVANPGRRTCITRVETFPASADSRQCTFSNLKSRTDYTFTVQALTLGGWGATSAPSNQVAQLDVQVTSGLRTKPFFVFPGTTRVRVSGVVSGIAPGTRLRTYMQIGTAAWREVRDANVRVDRSGRILFIRNVNPQYARRTVGVRFEVDTTGRCGEPFVSDRTCGRSNTQVLGSVR